MKTEPLEITYELYLKAVSANVTPNPIDIKIIDCRCPNRIRCQGCPLDYEDENCCLIDILEDTQELFDSYYKRALKNNPEYLL